MAAMEPEAALELTGRPELSEVAKEVEARLKRVLSVVAANSLH